VYSLSLKNGASFGNKSEQLAVDEPTSKRSSRIFYATVIILLLTMSLEDLLYMCVHWACIAVQLPCISCVMCGLPCDVRACRVVTLHCRVMMVQ